MFSSLINPLAILLSLSTATGVFVHDSRIDKAAMTAVALPAVVASYEIGAVMAFMATDAHTHSERGSFAQAVHDLKAQNPRIQPRSNESRKHLLQKNAPKGQHPFDNYNLPLA